MLLCILSSNTETALVMQANQYYWTSMNYNKIKMINWSKDIMVVNITSLSRHG